MIDKPLRGARVALIYNPGSLHADYAAGLVRGVERAFFEIGAEVATLNIALFLRSLHGGTEPYEESSPLVRGMVDFLNETWSSHTFDYCFGFFYDAWLTDRLMLTLRKRCTHVINYPLNLLDQPHLFKKSLAFCDETYCSEEAALDDLRREHGNRIRYVPMAADPYIYRPIDSPAEPRLLFVGTIYADRHKLLDRCAQVIDVSAYGAGHGAKGIARALVRDVVRERVFPSPRSATRMLLRAATSRSRIISDEEYVRLAAEHGVSIGFSEVRHVLTGRTVHKVRLREYEATMTGLCHITARLPEIERHFDIGKEILTFDDPAEVPDILGRVKSGDLKWKKIGEAARRRAATHHTWTARLRASFSGESASVAHG
jgi:hypothetical protein